MRLEVQGKMEIVIKNKDEIQIEEIDHDFVLSFNGQDGNIISIFVQRRYDIRLIQK